MRIEIEHLSEQELRTLNRRIVDRLRLIEAVRTRFDAAQFAPGDRVRFEASGGRDVRGTVIRCNAKTISIVADDGGSWKVSPGFLTHVEPEPQPQFATATSMRPQAARRR